uniref:Uncharacterized protein n=1 Tax=Strigamia maritima TaxID=126957 RepID=T1IRN4_STRMM
MRFNGRNFSIMDDNKIINNTDEAVFCADNEEMCYDDEETADLPKSLIVTNLDDRVYDNEDDKRNFEFLFEQYGEVAFQYFKSFRRARVTFQSPHVAAAARIQLHQADVCDKIINCYFAQPLSPKDDNKDPHLQPPKPDKQFLISPPASPPVGWEPVHEAQPMINYDLLSAIASMTPGISQELHPPSESQPGIVVHPCEDPQGCRGGKSVIPQTACPERT